MVSGYYWTLRASAGYKYDPDQPRIPAGQPGGGQWTTAGSWTLHEWSSLTPEEFERRTNLSMDDLETMFSLAGYDAEVELSGYKNMSGREEVEATITWTHPDGRTVGKCVRAFYLDRKQCENGSLTIYPQFRDRGLARSLYQRQIAMLRNRGYESITLFADSSIGRYAWARQGFDYNPDYYSRAGIDPGVQAYKEMRRWLGNKGIFRGDVLPKKPFKTAKEVADFDPGLVFTGADINASHSVPRDMKMHVGKAFMLDDSTDGHGSWEGILWLNK